MIWFTSDTHFGHKNIIQFCNRPWPNVGEMNAGLISNWNALVSDSDTVYHLGDLSFVNNEWTSSLLRQLKGEIVLVKGNHDRNWDSPRLSRIVQSETVEVEGQKLYLSHRPASKWEGAAEGVWHLHGHLHGNSYHRDWPAPTEFKRLDVGVDCWGWKPINVAQIKRHFEGRGRNESLDCYAGS